MTESSTRSPSPSASGPCTLRTTRGTLLVYVFCLCGTKVNVTGVDSEPRSRPAGGDTCRMRCRRAGIDHSNVTGILARFCTLKVRVVVAPTHVGLKKRLPSFSKPTLGTNALPITGSSTALTPELFRVHLKLELKVPVDVGCSRHASSWLPCAGTTPWEGSTAKGARRRGSANSKLTGVSPSFSSATVWYELSPLWHGVNSRRFVEKATLGMKSSVPPTNVCPTACVVTHHGGMKSPSATSLKLRIVLTYAKHSRLCE
mmetsp:Transcript_22924/g.78029  ORF Transcript_22924/g.78029 Transcript_22924/m.78029 type:complete len:258 (-) Transcript_22924:1733-2506(-)